MARGRPEIPKSQQKKVAKQLLDAQKRAGTYEKGLKDVGKGALAGSAYPVDVAEMMAKGALTPSASYKAATMRPRGGGIEKVPPPVQNPQLKGTYPYFAKKLGIEPDSAEGIAGSFFSLDPMAKAHAVAMGTKLILGKMAGLGLGASMFGGLKKVDTAKDVAKPIFTSPGYVATADIAKETIPANKVRSQLEGRGVNKDELEWTGFNEWIKTKKGEVSKAELEEFFQQNQIEVREVVRGGGPQISALPEGYSIEPLNRDGFGDYNEDYFTLVGPEGSGRVLSGAQTEEEALEVALHRLEIDYPSAYDTKFSSPSWQLPGGENYRELVLMVPPKKVPWTKENVVPMTTE
jgi:hypothetical protein